MNPKLLTRLGLSLPILILIGACMAQSNKPGDNLPTVRIGIGMSIEQLKAGSTYPFASSVQLAGDFQAFQITEPYNLVVVEDRVELELDGLGGQRELTNITVKQGKVADLTVTLQNGRTNLHKTMEQAKALHAWFSQHGFKSGADNNVFTIQQKNSARATPLMTNFQQAEAAFLDSDLRISEMILFGLRKDDVNVGVSLANTRRMRARLDGAFEGESSRKEEKAYMLTMFISQVISP